MAPKKKEQQKMSLNDFLADNGFGGGSWADEVEETYVAGTQPLPSADRSRPSGGMSSGWQDRGYSSLRENNIQTIPDKPPFTAHLGNLSYDATVESVTEFFEGSKIVSVRIIEDREMQRPKGFGYVEFEDVESLKQALTLDGQSFQGRMIKIKIADPPRGGDNRMGGMDSSRDLSDWTRRGPLPDLPGRSNNNNNRQPSDFGGERRRDPALESRPPREINWERRGPLPPLAQQEEGSGPRENSGPRGAGGVGMGERSESSRGPRPDRPERPERAERTETAAEKDFQWRERMRPDEAAAETPSSPTAAAAAPASRPRLNLQKRTVPEAGEASATGTPSDAKASPFGAARPIDTATREKEIEDKRQQALQEKREADDKAKEERKQAKIAAAAKAEEEAKEDTKEGETAETTETATKDEETTTAAATTTEGGEAGAETKVPIRSREPREPKDAVQNAKSRATEAGNWRSASGSEQRGPRGASGNQRGRGGPRGGRGYEGGGRGGRANGSPAQQQQQQQQTQQQQQAQQDAAGSDDAANTPDEDGWTTVPKKGRSGRPLA